MEEYEYGKTKTVSSDRLLYKLRVWSDATALSAVYLCLVTL